MKRILAVVTLVMLASMMYGAFEDLGWTARSRAMGNAIFGDFHGVDSMNYNPATISMERSIQVYGAWDNPAGGLDDGSKINVINADVVIPFFNSISLGFDPFFTKRATIGFSVHRMSVADPVLGIEYYHEGVYSFVYAKDLNDMISRGANISVGVRLSLYDLGVGESGDVLANPYLGGLDKLNKISFGMDVGITYDFSETIRIGLAYKNLISPSVSLFTNGDKMPTEFRLGANWEIGKLLFMRDANLGFGLITYGRDSDDIRQTESSYNVGFEFEAITIEAIEEEILAVRMGVVYQPKKNVEDNIDITGGIGFQYLFGGAHQINVDYTIEYSINMLTLQHVAGMTYQFHLPNSSFVYKAEERNEAIYEEELLEYQEEAADVAEGEEATEDTEAVEGAEDAEEVTAEE